MKCSDCPEYEVCRKYDLRKVRPRCKKSRTSKAFTNADKIRSMTDEELAEMLLMYEGTKKQITIYGDWEFAFYGPDGIHSGTREYALQLWIEWLKQPAEEE